MAANLTVNGDICNWGDFQISTPKKTLTSITNISYNHGRTHEQIRGAGRKVLGLTNGNDEVGEISFDLSVPEWNEFKQSLGDDYKGTSFDMTASHSTSASKRIISDSIRGIMISDVATAPSQGKETRKIIKCACVEIIEG